MAAERRKTLGLASPTLLTPNTNLYHNYKTQSVRVADHTCPVRLLLAEDRCGDAQVQLEHLKASKKRNRSIP